MLQGLMRYEPWSVAQQRYPLLPWGLRQGWQQAPLPTPAVNRTFTERNVHTHIGHFDQSVADQSIGRPAIHQQARGVHPAVQGFVEALTQVGGEALDLALSACPVRAAQADANA